jgi:hypothetical protein
MDLFALSDLHLGFAENRDAVVSLRARPNDWLILAGDLGETLEHFEFAFDVLSSRFQRLIWAPGNHDLWTARSRGGDILSGKDKYDCLVELCRSYDVLTPEDPYEVVVIAGQAIRLIPTFTLYDYSFRPDYVAASDAIQWAVEDGIFCSDERMLSCHPYKGAQEWCDARCRETEERLNEFEDGLPSILINHFPLRYDLVRLPRIPRFSIWCGTKRTEEWHRRYNAEVVVSGHVHVPSTDFRDGVRFEEVSLGYPRQWLGSSTIEQRLRRIAGDGESI